MQIYELQQFLCAHITSSHTFENVIQKINRRLNIYHIICTYIHKSFRREYNAKTPEEYKIDSHSINIFFSLFHFFYFGCLFPTNPLRNREKKNKHEHQKTITTTNRQSNNNNNHKIAFLEY